MRPNRTTVHCLRCGKAFQVKASRIAAGKGKFCSKECDLLARHAASIQQVNRITCICQQCGCTFFATASKRIRKYCSHSCSAVAQVSRVPRSCEHCGASFFADPGVVEKGKGRFCTKRCATNHRSRPIETRFWEKVSKTDTCWLWNGATSPNGYGVFGKGKDRKLPHRLSYELTYGPIPDGMNVCHRCDVPLCVRPDHLFLGSQHDNIADMYTKGRGHTGEAHHMTTVTADQVISIRKRHADGESLASLSSAFGMSTTGIHQIVRRKTWKHI